MRDQVLARARRLVVKLGSRLVAENPAARTKALADELAALRGRGIDAVVVSSGAIALGCQALRLSERPHELPRLQAAAAVGQGVLMRHWERAFAHHDTVVGQVLLTHDDLDDRNRFLNARHAIGSLLELAGVPIINENDTVATDEIRFGDNDRLAALACNLVGADLLVLLTDVDGLCDAPPEAGGTRIPLVSDIDREAAPVAGGTNAAGVGTGGVMSKVQAAKIAGRSGVPTVVASGRQEDVLARILRAEDIGTLFAPSSESRLASRKQWIAFARKPGGTLVVDAGARTALVAHRKSLLPSGIREIRGHFGMGEAVSVIGPDGLEFARGLSAYASEELDRIRGKHSADIETILGYKYLDEVIHRDDLVVL